MDNCDAEFTAGVHYAEEPQAVYLDPTPVAARRMGSPGKVAPGGRIGSGGHAIALIWKPARPAREIPPVTWSSSASTSVLMVTAPLHGVVPALFEGRRDEAIGGIDGFVSAFREVHVVTRSLDPHSPL